MRFLLKNFLDSLAFIISSFFIQSLNDIYTFFISRLITYSIGRKLGSKGANLQLHFSTIIINPDSVHIGNNFCTLPRLRIDVTKSFLGKTYKPELIFGDNVLFNSDCHIACINRIEIGNNVLLASKVFITDHSHGEISSLDLLNAPIERDLISKGPVIIKDNVWIGEGVVILPNVTIGENAIIGANSVVNKNIPDNAVAGGNPAKVIKIFNNSNNQRNVCREF